MALLGYARVSTNQQKLDHQIKVLIDQGVRKDRIFTDTASGKTDNREGLQKLLTRAEEGDVILVTKLDRLGRNTLDMVQIIQQLDTQGTSVHFLDDGIRTDGSMGKMVVTILSAVAQAERERILERTNEGRAEALAAGVKFGRKPHKGTDKAIEMINRDKPIKDVLERTGISRATYYRLKRYRNEG
ncbi:recombinase family protein [Neptuniibacter sp. QD37_11]|uniref:recombinase family protein n=1 Tax=Neptuniibacter sp. QD37_11 TaxID=3398209 RepID=UPI0039F571C0